jgi:hypothetical protein
LGATRPPHTLRQRNKLFKFATLIFFARPWQANEFGPGYRGEMEFIFHFIALYLTAVIANYLK